MTEHVFNRTRIIIVGMTSAFLLAILAVASALSWQQQGEALNNSAAQASRFVTGAVAAVNRTLLNVDVLMASLDESLQLSTSHADTLDAAAAHQTLRTIVQRNLILKKLALVDAQGRVLATSDPQTNVPLTLPPEFMARTLRPNVAALTISLPQLSPDSVEATTLLARHIKLADGSRLMVVAQVQTMQLTTIMVQGADIDALEVTLERMDGRMLASDPANDKLLGQPLASALGRGTQGAQRLPARLSAQDALVVAQPILYDDVLIAASIPVDAALAKWRNERLFIVLVSAGFIAMVLSAGFFSRRYLEHLTSARLATQRTRAEISQLAFYDHLTHLPNRLLLTDRLEQALTSALRYKRFGALFFLDLDNFKTINDTLGHNVGDVLLEQVATRLTGSVRNVDTVARFGGDEFVLLLEDLAPQPLDAAELAQRIGKKVLKAMNTPFDAHGRTLKTSCSIGAAIFGHAPILPAELLKQADIAMYQAKALGRNKMCFFDPQMQARISDHAALEADLQIAIEQNQFVLYFQPQVHQAGQVLGAEVLIRWQHPQRGMVPPFEFIPIAEESDLINQIGLWVLRTACQQLQAWQQSASTAHLQLAVNVSARQFRQADFVAVATQVIRDCGIDPGSLKLELTESLVLDNVDDTITKMSQLRSLGVRFSMDDFGTGQSSLSYLTRLPLDQLKIDQSFVRNIGVKPTNGMVVQTIIGMAHNLALEVIAEGVETREQQAFLAAHGCTLYQGYLFGKPVPLAEFAALLAHPTERA